jgi:hypothetical protein
LKNNRLQLIVKRTKTAYIMWKRILPGHQNLFETICQEHMASWVLLCQIASRARWATVDNPQIGNLTRGEARIGDYRSIGLTEQQYRTAKSNLVKWKLITIKSTKKGTIARLSNTDIFDLNLEAHNGQINDQGNDQPTTNKEGKKEKNEIEHKLFDRFWSVYDKKVNRKGALKQWEKLTEAETDLVMIHAPEYIKSTPDKQFRKNPKTYLHQETWKDELMPISTGIQEAQVAFSATKKYLDHD